MYISFLLYYFQAAMSQGCSLSPTLGIRLLEVPARLKQAVKSEYVYKELYKHKLLFTISYTDVL